MGEQRKTREREREREGGGGAARDAGLWISRCLLHSCILSDVQRFMTNCGRSMLDTGAKYTGARAGE